MEVTKPAWKKAKSSSGGANNCVELLRDGAARDSKNPDGPTLSVNLASLLAAAKAGRLDS